MAIRFAISSGNWSNTSIWDNGVLPIAGDDVYNNGFGVTIDTNINVSTLRNTISPVYLPAMPIPAMTGNIVPSGTVIAGSDTSNAWKAFDQDAVTPTFWAGTGVGSGTAWIGYNFTSVKIIKRYYIYRTSQNPKPTSWTFDGSNDGSTWTTLETITSNALNTPYLSGVLPNTTAYLYYRINVTAVTSGTIANIYQFEMTESINTTYGIGSNSSFSIVNSQTITLTGSTALYPNSLGAYLLINGAASPNVININCGSNFFSNSNTNWYFASVASATVNITGNLYLSPISINMSAAGGSINIIGNITGNCVTLLGSATHTITGSLLGNPITSTTSSCVTYSGSGILNIIGQLSSNLSPCLTLSGLNTVNITGSITGSATREAISGTINLLNISTGIITSGTGNSAISCTGTGLITLNNISLINKNNIIAIYFPRIRFASTSTPYWIFQTNGASDITLAYGAATGAYPIEADVRFGTTYADSPIRTGTLRVPLPQYVSQGVLTDNTTGTAYLSASDVWNIQTSTLTIAGSIGERLKTASTVQTNGDQLASYIV